MTGSVGGIHSQMETSTGSVLTEYLIYGYYSQIMLEQAPEIIDPLLFVEKRRHIRGSVEVSRMSRLVDLLHSQDGEVSFDLKFEKEGRIAAITGEVKAQLVLQCQCCLGPVTWPVSSQVSLGIVHSIDEADLLPESYEPLLLDANETLALIDLVQDELLLAVPQVPQHQRCEISVSEKSLPTPDLPKRANPFEVLAKLKS